MKRNIPSSKKLLDKNKKLLVNRQARKYLIEKNHVSVNEIIDW